MKPENFCYWLQGFFEISEGNQLTEKQVEMIKRHLQLVFVHVDEQSLSHINDPKLKKQLNDNLNKIHNTFPFQNGNLTTYRC